MKLRSAKREKAAVLVAEDRYSDVKIAAVVGISERQLQNWKGEELFQERVADLTAAYSERALKFGLARRERRLQVLTDLHDGLLTIVEERSRSSEYAEVPGGKTGLLVRRVKGQAAEYETDTALVKGIRGVQEQIAKELGAWKERHEISGPDDGAIKYSNLTDRELDDKIQELMDKLGLKKMEDGDHKESGTTSIAD